MMFLLLSKHQTPHHLHWHLQDSLKRCAGKQGVMMGAVFQLESLSIATVLLGKALF